MSRFALTPCGEVSIIRAVPRRSRYLRLLAIPALLAVGVLIPLHLAHEHLDELASNHEESGHDEADHGSLTLVRIQHSAVALPAPASAIWVVAAAAADGLPSLAMVSGTDRACDLPPPGRAALSHTPPRAPPATLA